MSTHRVDRPRRAAAWAGVLLLLAGSNYCLVAGLAGVPMSCLGLASEAAAAPTGHCAKTAGDGEGRACHGATAPSGAAAGPSDATELAPCCVVLVSTATAQVECPPADAATLATVAPMIDAPATEARWSAPAADESPPGLRFTPASHRGRAPPLA